MKFYIKAVSIEDLRAQYQDIPERRFKEIINLDPTANYDENKRGKYGPWLLKHYKAGDLTPDTYANVTDSLTELSNPVLRRRYELKDLNQYKTVQDLIDAHIAAQNVQLELSQRQQARNAHRQARETQRRRLSGEDTGDIREVVSEGTWTVYQPLTWAGNIALAMEGVDTSRPYTDRWRDADNLKAQWCTAGEGNDHWWREYSSQCPIYVFIDSSDPINKFQSCLGADRHRSWWFDKKDDELGQRAFLNFCNEHPGIGAYFKVRTVGGVQVMGDTVMGYAPDATEINIPDGVATLPSFKFPASCKKVTLPDSITIIKSGTFTGTGIETVEFKNVTTIERQAFNGSKIKNIDLSNVTTFGSHTFKGCSELTAVTLRSDATVGAYAFDSCNLKGTITHYPESTISTGSYDNNPELTVVWKDDDYGYAFHNIKELVIANNQPCPLLERANEETVPVKVKK